MNWSESGTNEILSQIQLYHQQARRQNKPIIYFATPDEMAVLKEGAGNDPDKLAWLEKNYRVYEFMEEKEYDHEENQAAPLNRADRRRLRFRKTGKPVVSAKRT